MTTVWRSLLWKEWREQRWILLGILAIAALGPLPFAWEDSASYRVGLVMMAALFVPLASVFVGAWIAAGEQSRQTIDFLQALPVPMSTPARVKLLCATGVVLAPGVIGCAIGLLWSWQHRTELVPKELATGVTILTAITLLPLSFMLWTAAFGANVRDEMRAGVLGLASACAIWLVFTVVAAAVTRHHSDDMPTWLAIAAAAAPGSPGFLLSDPDFRSSRGFLVGFVSVMLVAHAAFAQLYVRRFGRFALPRRMTAAVERSTGTENRWLAPPRRSALTSVAWKQWRETAPLAGIGLAAILAVAAMAAVIVARLNPSSIDDSAAFALFAWVAIGYAVAVVCGIGLLHDDLRPSIDTFWRSRPIRLGPWFAAKLTTSLAITLASLAAPPLLLVIIVGLATRSHPSESDYATMAAVLAYQTCGFLVAAAATAVLRTATAAALVTLLATVLGMYLAVQFDAFFNNGDAAAVIAVTAATAAIAISVAWLALKKNWRLG